MPVIHKNYLLGKSLGFIKSVKIITKAEISIEIKS
jgi:hypothetical protein